MHIWMTSSGPEHQRHKPLCWLKLYWKLGYTASLYQFLGCVIRILVFLVA